MVGAAYLPGVLVVLNGRFQKASLASNCSSSGGPSSTDSTGPATSIFSKWLNIIKRRKREKKDKMNRVAGVARLVGKKGRLLHTTGRSRAGYVAGLSLKFERREAGVAER